MKSIIEMPAGLSAISIPKIEYIKVGGNNDIVFYMGSGNKISFTFNKSRQCAMFYMSCLKRIERYNMLKAMPDAQAAWADDLIKRNLKLRDLLRKHGIEADE